MSPRSLTCSRSHAMPGRVSYPVWKEQWMRMANSISVCAFPSFLFLPLWPLCFVFFLYLGFRVISDLTPFSLRFTSLLPFDFGRYSAPTLHFRYFSLSWKIIVTLKFASLEHTPVVFFSAKGYRSDIEHCWNISFKRIRMPLHLKTHQS